MNILYVARHFNANSNDDEGAVEWALRELGHSVRRHDEGETLDVSGIDRDNTDLVLFNKWKNPGALEELGRRGVTRAFWYWDLVDFPGDPALVKRSRLRREWMETILPRVNLGFCTDGDWAAIHPHKLSWLPQGADERLCSPEPRPADVPGFDVLFTGAAGPIRSERERFAEELESRLGALYYHIPEGAYRNNLRDVYAAARIVVAPDTPVTDLYWSNRVYNVLGLGGFLLHPYCGRLAEDYADRGHLYFYRSRDELFSLIERLRRDAYDGHRRCVARAGWEHTLRFHTYRRRCEILVRTVEEYNRDRR